MQTAPRIPAKVFHLTMPMAAGPGLDRWLEKSGHQMRARPAAFPERWQLGPLDALPFMGREEDRAERLLRLSTMAKYSIDWYDVLHGPIDITPWLPEGSLAFTVLREPVEAALAQYRAIAALPEDAFAGSGAVAVETHAAIRAQPLAESAARLGHDPVLSRFFRNPACSLLTQRLLDAKLMAAMPPATLADLAWQSLRNSIALVGFSDGLEPLSTVLAARLGLVPPVAPAPHDFAPPEAGEATAADRAAAAELGPADRILYDRARGAFAAPLAEEAGAYLRETFEERHAPHLGERLQPLLAGQQHVFDMNMAVFGAGLYNRDAAGTERCCVWVGPSPVGVLYLPVPEGRRLLLRFCLQGWMSNDLRPETVLRLDGAEAPWTYEDQPDLHGAIRAEHRTSRPWLRVEFRLPRTLSDADLGRDGDDPRSKGLNLTRYSYEIVG